MMMRLIKKKIVDLAKREKNFKMMKSLIKKKRMVLVQKNTGENWIVSQMK